uniref:Bone morphogenetic protein 15 n=1 Tax=Tetraodon nigroviridis TaxID=99883 RepID=H3CJS3_TETNG
RPLTDEQKADQNLQFMMSLYRSAAEPDGRPKQHRKFGSNTVRLLKPSASSVSYLPASPDHQYHFSVQYHLDTLPSEQLVRASFVHLRSAPAPFNSSQGAPPPRCRARVAPLGRESLVVLEPHQRWTETDITAHVRQRQDQSPGGALTLTAQYRCTAPMAAQGGGGLPRPWAQRRGGQHLEVPSLLLYLEEERDGNVWMGDLLGPEQRRRRRRSNEDSVISNIPSSKRSGGTPKNRCRLHSFRLSFDELGWGHYFIAPPVYNPRFCQGNCPRVLHYGYHSPNHAIIQTVISDLGVGDVPPPSCVPYKYMPMSVLVVHKKKVEYRELEDMVAESCTCR